LKKTNKTEKTKRIHHLASLHRNNIHLCSPIHVNN
jgi:hypothetical protein